MDLEVSVVIPTHGRAPFLRESLQSVAAQTRRPDEIIVVDDGSEPATRDRKAALAAEYGCQFIASPERRGAAYARNIGAAAAKGNFLCFLDHDDMLLPSSTEKKLARLRSAPDAALCYGGYVYVNERGEEVEKPVIPYKEGDAFCQALAHFEIFLSPSCVMVSRICFEEVGGFDSDRSLFHCEDYDLWLRLALGGWPVVAVPEVLSQWRRHADAWAHEFTAESIDLALVALLSRAENKFPRWSHDLRNQRAEVLYRLGRYAMIAGSWEKAKEALKQSIVADPFRWKPYPRYMQVSLASVMGASPSDLAH